MLPRHESSLRPMSFASPSAFNSTMNRAGDRADGPWILAVWAGRKLPGSARGRHEGRMHAHRRGQLMCIEDGLMQVRTDQGSWLVPPNRAVWVPPTEMHRVDSNGVTRSWNLFLSPSASKAMPDAPCVVAVNTLVHVLAQRATTWSDATTLSPSQRRMAMVLLDELRRAPRDPLHLPMPKDRRLARIAAAIAEDPSDSRTKAEWASLVGLSERTLSRQFQSEVNMGFGQWRQQALLVHALERLLKGESVSSVSDSLGYAAPSNFITMFRKALGDSPAHYIARAKD